MKIPPAEIPYEQKDGPTASQLVLIVLVTLSAFFVFIYNVSP